MARLVNAVVGKELSLLIHHSKAMHFLHLLLRPTFALIYPIKVVISFTLHVLMVSYWLWWNSFSALSSVSYVAVALDDIVNAWGLKFSRKILALPGFHTKAFSVLSLISYVQHDFLCVQSIQLIHLKKCHVCSTSLHLASAILSL